MGLYQNTPFADDEAPLTPNDVTEATILEFERHCELTERTMLRDALAPEPVSHQLRRQSHVDNGLRFATSADSESDIFNSIFAKR
jgi:hypothetical protein